MQFESSFSRDTLSPPRWQINNRGKIIPEIGLVQYVLSPSLVQVSVCFSHCVWFIVPFWCVASLMLCIFCTRDISCTNRRCILSELIIAIPNQYYLNPGPALLEAEPWAGRLGPHPWRPWPWDRWTRGWKCDEPPDRTEVRLMTPCPLKTHSIIFIL